MHEWLANRQLGVLLRLTPYLVRRAAARSARLRQLLGEGSFIFQVATAAGAGGCFVLDAGRLRFAPGLCDRPDFEQVWLSAGDAVRAMTSRDETDLLRALEDGKCAMSGRFTVALWFNEAMKIARMKPDSGR